MGSITLGDMQEPLDFVCYLMHPQYSREGENDSLWQKRREVSYFPGDCFAPKWEDLFRVNFIAQMSLRMFLNYTL